MIAKHRRVVAGVGEDGRSRVMLDDFVEQDMAPTIGGAVNLWSGAMVRVSNEAPIADGLIPYEFQQLHDASYRFQLAVYGPKVASGVVAEHYTHTIDHWYIVEGEIVLVLDEEDVVLKAGDSGVCRGAMHSWRNDSDRPAKLVAMVMPAEPLRVYDGVKGLFGS